MDVTQRNKGETRDNDRCRHKEVGNCSKSGVRKPGWNSCVSFCPSNLWTLQMSSPFCYTATESPSLRFFRHICIIGADEENPV